MLANDPANSTAPPRVESVWSKDHEDRFMAAAPDRMRRAFLIAIWTDQRQGDLYRLAWSANDGETIRLH